MIIDVKDKDSVWIAADSGSTNLGLHEEDLILEDNLTLWRVPGKPDALMASTHAEGIDLDRLRYEEDLPLAEPLTRNSLLLETVPQMKALFDECGMLRSGEAWQNCLIAKGDRAFIIHTDFTCCDVEDFHVLGYGGEYAHGAMLHYKSLPPLERIAQVFRALKRIRNTKYFPIVVMNTKTAERTVIYE